MNTGIYKTIQSFFITGNETDMKHLKVGDDAPYFEGMTDKNETVKLTDFRGKKLALFFYPAANTPTCTTEACNLRDHYQELKDKGIAVLGVSPDSVKKQANFSKKFAFPYDLLADTELTVLSAYGVWGPKKFMGREFDGVHRMTFLIDEAGKIAQIIDNVVSANHAAQLLALV